MRHSWRVPAFVLALLLPAAVAWAEWLAGGNRIGDDAATGYGFVITGSGPDRVVVAWIRPGFEIRAQAWLADGTVVPGWEGAGVPVASWAHGTRGLTICEDGVGGAFVGWPVMTAMNSTNSITRLQHLRGDGSRAPGWPAEGLEIFNGPYSGSPVLAADGAGGVLVGYVEHMGLREFRTTVHRLDAGGTPTPGWPAAGLSLPGEASLGILVDAEDHVFVATSDYDPVTYESIGIRVRRLDGNAAPDPAWPAEGTLLTHAMYSAPTMLYSDESGGVFADWQPTFICLGLHCEPTFRRAARVLGDGSADGRWIPGPPGYSLAPDGTGGILIGLVNDGRPAVTRLDAGGIVMPGWTTAGNPAMTEYVFPGDVKVAADGRGGAFVTWQDQRTHMNRIYASRLDPTGRLAPGWPSTGSFVDAGRAWPSAVQLVSLGADVALALWEEQGASGYLTALKPGEPGPISELGRGFGIVHAIPNPAFGPISATIELGDQGPGRLDVVDAAGRVHQSQDVSFQPPGRGVVTLNQGRTLPAGVYWLYLTQRDRKSTKKVVVLE